MKNIALNIYSKHNVAH